MSIVNTLALESNRQIKINFDGGDLSSDAGLLLNKEFISKLGIDKLLDKTFKTNNPALFRYHTNQKNLLQMIYMIIAGYFEDDAFDELTNGIMKGVWYARLKNRKTKWFTCTPLLLNIPDDIPSAVRRYGNHFLASLLCIPNHNFYENISKGCYAPQMRQGLD